MLFECHFGREKLLSQRTGFSDDGFRFLQFGIRLFKGQAFYADAGGHFMMYRSADRTRLSVFELLCQFDCQLITVCLFPFAAISSFEMPHGWSQRAICLFRKRARTLVRQRQTMPRCVRFQLLPFDPPLAVLAGAL